MTSAVNPLAGYNKDEDARNWAAGTSPSADESSVGSLVLFLSDDTPALRWVPMHRSAGKTWLAQAIVRPRPGERPDESPGSDGARYLIDGGNVVHILGGQRLGGDECACLDRVADHLKGTQDGDPPSVPPTADGSSAAPLLVLDEPGCFLTPPRDGITSTDQLAGDGFVKRVNELVAAGWKVLTLLSPAEWSACAEYVKDVDGVLVVTLGGLTTKEQTTLFSRLDTADDGASRLHAAWPDWAERPLLARAVLSALQRQDTSGGGHPPQSLDEDQLDQLAKRLVDNGLTTGQRRSLLGGKAGKTGPTFDSHTERLLAEARAHPVLRRRLLSQPLTVHIVSDIHLGDEAAQAADDPLVRYVKHLGTLSDTSDAPGECRAPNVVIVAGDLVEKGGDDAQMAAAVWFLSRVAPHIRTHPAVACDDPNLVVLPGNHDIPWDTPNDSTPAAEATTNDQRHRWFVDRLETARSDDNSRLSRMAIVDQPVTTVRFERCGVEIAGVRTTEATPPVAPHVLKECRQLVTTRADTPGDESAPSDPLNELLAMWERLDPSGVADPALTAVRTRAVGGVRIVAGHHPVTPMDETSDRPYSMMLNAGPFKRAMIDGGAALYVHGHAHQGWLSSERRCGTTGGSSPTLRVASAPTLGGEVGNALRGYLEVTVRHQDSCLTRPIVSARLVSLAGSGFEAQPAVWFRPGETSDYSTLDELLDADPDRWNPVG